MYKPFTRFYKYNLRSKDEFYSRITLMKTIKKTFPVTGMTCASCSLSVEKTLKAQKGVLSASVNLAGASALVAYDQDAITPDRLKKLVNAIGYDLIVEADVTAEDIEALNLKTYRALQTRTSVAVALSIPLFIIAMLGMHIPYANYIMWALATPVLVFCGRQFFTGAWKQLKHGTASMDTLVALSTGIAYLFSVFNTVYPAYWVGQGLEAPVYFEASAIVVSFILLGKLLEDRAKSNTSSAIKKLMNLQPYSVVKLTDNGEEVILLKEVKVNDILVIKPGYKIAVDGSVTEGNSYVNESMITGEPVAVAKTTGARVFAGTINQKGSFRMKAEKVGNETLLAQIIKKVQEAQGSKAPVQKLVDKIASVFVPVVLLISLLTLGVWVFAGGENGVTHGILSMITVLVIACPCALGLATPTAIVVGVGKGAENGILVKDAQSLEIIHKINAIVFDKTGTLTEGTPQVVDIAWKEDSDHGIMSSLIYSMELLSEHPLAGAITSFFKELHINPVEVSSFSSITGAGVTALYARTIYFAGSLKMLQSMNIAIPEPLMQKAGKWTAESNTVVWLANPFTAICAIAIADKIKTSSSFAVKELQSMGVQVYMLTGDNQSTAYTIAEQAGITQFKADASPAEKAEFIKSLQKEGKIVAMAGDGINDSQALAQADVSIAMGKGNDIAMDVAMMTLISSDLRQIAKAISLSGNTVKTIRQNLFWAFIYNIIAIPVAAGILYPVNCFLLNPMLAGAAMALSSVSVVANSLRLKWKVV